jgi:cytochrome b561
MRTYYLFVFVAMKWISGAFLAVTIIIAGCVLADWVGRLGWNYPWYSALVLTGFSIVGMLVNRAAIRAINQIRPLTDSK